jgi:hypothetical protein
LYLCKWFSQEDILQQIKFEIHFSLVNFPEEGLNTPTSPMDTKMEDFFTRNAGHKNVDKLTKNTPS